MKGITSQKHRSLQWVLAMFINVKYIALLIIVFFITGCQEDLMPSNDPIESTSVSREGEVIDDLLFTFSDGSSSSISERLSTHDAVVLYFTMWCPICDAHMSHIRSQIQPQYSNVDFIFVDYVSGSVVETMNVQRSSGYTDFNVIADTNNELEAYFNGTMASTIIINKNFLVKLNGLFKTGNEIKSVLNKL